MLRPEETQEQRRQEDIAQSEQVARDMQRTEETKERQGQERAAQNFREDADKRARQQAEQHGGGYHALPKVNLIAMVNLRCLDFSVDKTMLVQRLIEDDNERKNNDNKDSSDQTTEDSIQEIQQAKPPDLLQEDTANSRVHRLLTFDTRVLSGAKAGRTRG